MASTSATSSRAAAGDRKLQLKEIVDWLVEDGHVDNEGAQKLLSDARLRPGRHPIVAIGDAKLRSKKPPGVLLTPDMVTEWLAPRVKMTSYRIDPLKIDLRAVTQVMSADYAQRRGILPVEVKGADVTIAVSEPWVTSWEGELSQMLRLNIKRVLANPVDIERYQGEFFNLAKSMKRAEAAGVQTTGLSNFEQLV